MLTELWTVNHFFFLVTTFWSGELHSSEKSPKYWESNGCLICSSAYPNSCLALVLFSCCVPHYRIELDHSFLGTAALYHSTSCVHALNLCMSRFTCSVSCQRETDIHRKQSAVNNSVFTIISNKLLSPQP